MHGKNFHVLICVLFFALISVFAQDFDPIAHILQELSSGSRHIIVPPGTYILDKEEPAPYLSLTDAKDTVIDLTGVTFIGKNQFSMLYMKECENVTIKGMTVDYQDLPFSQGIITAIDGDKNWDIEIIEGYPCHDVISDIAFWPIQVYDKDTLELINPMRYQNNIQMTKTGDRTYRITGGKNTTGKLGDIVVFSSREPSCQPASCAIILRSCLNCTLENITVYSTPTGPGYYDRDSSGTTLDHCRLIRCPENKDYAPRKLKRLRSGNQDAFMFRCNKIGPRILDCTALYHCDDCINISGYCGVIFESNGPHLRVGTNQKTSVIQQGETAQIITSDGDCLEGLAIRSVISAAPINDEEKEFLKTVGFWAGFENECTNIYNIELADAPVRKIERGSFISSENANGNGFIIRGCHLGRNRGQGILLRASNGVIENNIIENTFGPGIGCLPEIVWLESGSSSNVTIVGNTFFGNRGGGIRIGGTATHHKPLQPTAHKNIRILDNWIMGTQTGIVLRGCTNTEVRDNKFQLEDGAKSIVVKTNCESCKIEYPPTEDNKGPDKNKGNNK